MGLILSFSTPYLKTVVEIISVAHRHLSHMTNILLIAHKTAAGGTEEDFKQNWNVLTDITKIPNFIQIQIWKWLCYMQMDKQKETDMMKVVVTFCNFVNVPNNDDNDNNNSNRVEGRWGHGAKVLVASTILSLALELHISRYYKLFTHWR